SRTALCRRRHSASGALGRLPPATASHRVLAGPPQPPARPPALPARRRRLDTGTAGAVTRPHRTLYSVIDPCTKISTDHAVTNRAVRSTVAGCRPGPGRGLRPPGQGR